MTDKTSSTKAESDQLSPSQGNEDFKTSNPLLFPSLHPLGNLYKQRNTQTNPRNGTTITRTFSSEPIKKIKLNDLSAKPLLHFEKSPKKEETGESIAETLCQRFQRKSLPIKEKNPRKKRLQKKDSQDSVSQNSLGTKEENLCSLVTPDPIFQEFQNFENQRVDLDPSLSSHSSQYLECQLAFQNYRKALLLNELDQRQLFPLNSQPFSSQIEGPQVDSLTQKLKQTAPWLFDLCQLNQDLILQKLKEFSMKQRYLNAINYFLIKGNSTIKEEG